MQSVKKRITDTLQQNQNRIQKQMDVTRETTAPDAAQKREKNQGFRSNTLFSWVRVLGQRLHFLLLPSECSALR